MMPSTIEIRIHCVSEIRRHHGRGALAGSAGVLVEACGLNVIHLLLSRPVGRHRRSAAPKGRVREPVEKVKAESDQEPVSEPFPGRAGQPTHHVYAQKSTYDPHEV